MDEKSEKSLVKRQFLTFCKTTSMKGVPRIFKTDRACVKGTWIVAVVCLLSITFFHVVSLLISYFQYGVITNYNMEYITAEATWNFYPSITLCNLNPLNSNNSKLAASKDLMTISEFFDEVERYLDGKSLKDPSVTDIKSHVTDIKSHMMTYRAYKEYLGYNNGIEVGHQIENFIIKCSLLGTDTVHTHTVDCGKVAELERTVSPDLFNCYTFKVNKTKLNMNLMNKELFIEGVSFVVYLDNLIQESTRHFSSSADTMEATGIRVFLHQQGTLPEFSKGFDVAAGFSTTIYQQPVRFQKLSSPYGLCLKPEEIPHLIGPNGHKVMAKYLNLCLRFYF